MLRSNRFPGMTALTRFHPRQIEVSMESVKGRRRQLVAPLLKLRLGPIPIQADDVVAEVFGKRQSILPFTDQDIAKSTTGRAIVHMTTRHPFAVEIDQKYFAMVLEARPIIPGLARFKLRMGSPAPCHHGRVWRLVLRWIMVKNALAGFARNYLRRRADFVVGLRTQHDLARQALVVAGFGNARPAMPGDAIVLTEQIGIHAGSRRVAFGIPLSYLLFVFGGALPGLDLFLFNLCGLGFQLRL